MPTWVVLLAGGLVGIPAASANPSVAAPVAQIEAIAARVVRVAAQAEPAELDREVTATRTTVSAPRPWARARHALYLDVLGKGGLWGLGYDLQLGRRLAVGGVGSFYILGGDRYTTFSPYLAAYPVLHDRHRWFVQVGPQIVRRHTPSPVPEWNGMSSMSFGGEMSTGYEYRNGFLARVYVMAAYGDRFVPWLGASFGWSW